MSMKAQTARDAKRLEDIPNIGPAMVRDFNLLGIRTPYDLIDKDPFQLYNALGTRTGARQDPCVLDTYLAAVDFMNGAPARAWWQYTPMRKKRYPDV
jgi:hypothetical protein